MDGLCDTTQTKQLVKKLIVDISRGKLSKMQILDKYTEFAQTKPQLFQMICDKGSDFDMEYFEMMLQKVQEIHDGKLTKDEADTTVSTDITHKFVDIESLKK